MKIAIIPARGGSKRIPRKNVKDFCGKPMLAWPIAAALKAGCFDEIIVSTDDEEIAAVAESAGAKVPFRRSPELSDDHTPTAPVIAEAIRWWKANRGTPDVVCCIYATAPFITPADLLAGSEALASDSTAEFAFSVTSFAFPIFRAVRIGEAGYTEMFWPEHELTRSQELPEAFHDAGQFYWGRTESWLKQSRIFSARSIPIRIPRSRVQDIDTGEDWQRAEAMFRSIT